MRVLHVMNTSAGGAAMSTIDIMAGLRRLDVDSVAVCHTMGSAEEEERLRDATRGRVQFRTLYWWNKKNRASLVRRPFIEGRQLIRTGASFGSAAGVVRFANRFAVDVVHTNTMLTPEGGLAAFALGLPHLWHIRERVGPGNPFRFPTEGRRLGRIMESLADIVLANSRSTGEAVRTWLRPEVLRVLENAIDTNRYNRVPVRRGTTATAPIIVGMVGNLTCRWKRHDLFIDVAKRFQGQNVLFRLYGHGGEAGTDPYVRSLMAEIEALPNLEFRGFVQNPVEMLSEMDVLLHPTGQESYGRAVVEAMAAARPIVGVAQGGVAETAVNGRTGYLVPEESSIQLADALARLLADADALYTMACAARKHANERFSLAAYCEQLVQLYSVCGARARQRVGRRRWARARRVPA